MERDQTINMTDVLFSKHYLFDGQFFKVLQANGNKLTANVNCVPKSYMVR